MNERLRADPMQVVEYAIVAGALVFAITAPLYVGGYWANTLLTQVFWLGIAAASLIFLSAYGGMVSLAQVALYGIAGFTFANLVTTEAVSKGQHLGLNPWVGIVLTLAITTAIGLLLGAVASRSAGIYFLMITLAFGVLANIFFGQVTDLSGFSGIGQLALYAPGIIDPQNHPNRLYYVALVASVIVYLLMRYVIRTPFGIALQGVRDEPVRMGSLGYNVALHRTLAFGFGAFVAAISGILFVWWNNQIAPGSIDLGAIIDLLIIAVIGGLFRLEGAWVGAFVFVILNNYTRDIPLVHYVGISEERFHTLIGVAFLLIVLLNPGGLIGIWEWFRKRMSRRLGPKPRSPEPIPSPAGPGAGI